MSKNKAFTLLEISIVIIAIAVAYGAFQVSKKMISNASNLVALNQADNNWDTNSSNVTEEEESGSSFCCPNLEANLHAWYDASDATTVISEEGVLTWQDKSENAFHVSQSIANDQATHIANSDFNNLTVFDFDGTDYFVNSSFGNIGQGAIFAVAQYAQEGGNQEQTIMELSRNTTVNDGFSLFQQGGKHYHRHNGGDFTYSSNLSSGPHLGIFSIILDGSNMKVYRNGTYRGQKSGGTITRNVNRLTVGALPIVNNTSYRMKGEIAEIIIFDRALDDTERGEVETYLNDKWAIY